MQRFFILILFFPLKSSLMNFLISLDEICMSFDMWQIIKIFYSNQQKKTFILC